MPSAAVAKREEMPAVYIICVVIGVLRLYRSNLMSNLILANNLAPDGFILEMDGQFESEYGSHNRGIESGLGTQTEVPA
jgi:hypothetical protein